MTNCRQSDTFAELLDQIKGDILFCPERNGGSKLVEAEIAERLNCSRAPVREALRYLASEGLVKIIPNRGAFVSSLNDEETQEVFNLRILLEEAIIEKIILNDVLQESDFAYLESCVQAMEEAVSGASETRHKVIVVVQNDVKFHSYIWNSAKLNLFVKTLKNLHNRLIVSMYKDYYMRCENMMSDVQMHYDIIKFLRKGHVAKTVDSMRNHMGICYK